MTASQPLRLMTINTAKGDYDYARRVAFLRDELVALRPDIVLVQEALTTAPDAPVAADTAATLAQGTGLAATTAPARRKQRLADGQWCASTSGLAVLTGLPVLAHETLPLPADAADGERIALLLQLTWGDTTLTLVNVHFTHLRNPESNETRRHELATVLAHPWLANLDGPCLIGGDCNTILPNLPALIDGQAGFDLRDAWVLANGGAARDTIVPARGASYCLDYVLSVVPPGGGHLAFSDAAVVLDTPDADGRYPSDHRGVAITVHPSTITQGLAST